MSIARSRATHANESGRLEILCQESVAQKRILRVLEVRDQGLVFLLDLNQRCSIAYGIDGSARTKTHAYAVLSNTHGGRWCPDDPNRGLCRNARTPQPRVLGPLVGQQHNAISTVLSQCVSILSKKKEKRKKSRG